MIARRGVVLAASLLPLAQARAANRSPERFPERPVRIVVPYAVGVGPDVVARSVGDFLSRQWQQPVIVDNKPGASGIVAFSEVRRTPADGHTLFLADTATMAVNPLIHSTLPYDPERDLVPLTLLFRATFVILVGGKSRFRSIAELIDAARRETDRVSYASLGNGHASHVAIETFARAADTRMLHVPFKDVGALFTSVAGGDVDFTAFGMNTAGGLVESGRLRPLAVAARARLRQYPQIPTLPEAGGPPVQMHPWAALVARTGTPQALLDQLHRDVTMSLNAFEVRARIEGAGFEITPSTPQQLRERVQADLDLYRPLVEERRVTSL